MTRQPKSAVLGRTVHSRTAALVRVTERSEVLVQGKGCLVTCQWKHRGHSSTYFNLGAICRLVVRVMLRPLYPLERIPVPTGQRVGPMAGLDVSYNRKLLEPAEFRTPNR